MTFEEQLRAFAHKTDERLNVVVKKIVFDISSRLVLRSPVGDAKYWVSPPPPGYVGGRFRANWQYGLDRVDATTTEQVDASGRISIGRVNSGMPADATGHIHYLTNSLSYGPRLEYGWSRQAPNGMVALTQLEFDPIVKQAVAELS
jgi:hypothetical protein